MPELHALILAGGSGTRFWPWSREARPKQLLALDGERSLLENTLDRLEGWVDPARRWILTRTDLLPSIRDLLPDYPPERILAEPERRDTAPALALAALVVRSVDPGGILLVVPSDHYIADPSAFRATVESAQRALLVDDALYTFGVTPTEPAIGYGYIERGDPTASSGVCSVRAFREKPDRPTAEAYLASGEHLWNAGIFLFRGATFLEELERHAPDFRDGLAALGDAIEGGRNPEAIAEGFRRLPRISVDYALFERSDRVRVVEAAFPWDDVGSWEAIPRLRGAEADDAGNLLGPEDVAIDCHGSVALSGEGRTIALLGVEDLLVIDSGDAVLVCPRNRAQEVRTVVEELRRRGRIDLV